MDEAPAHEFAVVLQKNDDPVPHLCKVACLKNCETDGSVILVAFENIGNRIQWEKSLQKAKKRAEIQEELKSSFFSKYESRDKNTHEFYHWFCRAHSKF
jgi:hypothetical protein